MPTFGPSLGPLLLIRAEPAALFALSQDYTRVLAPPRSAPRHSPRPANVAW